jgi:hypothetical protein
MAYVPYRGDVDGPDGGFGDNPSLASDELCERETQSFDETIGAAHEQAAPSDRLVGATLGHR